MKWKSILDRVRWLALLFTAVVASALRAQEPPDTNYDESKVPPYTLPDALVCFDGRTVTNLPTWERIRRPEILRTFATQVYGVTPAIPIALRAEILRSTGDALNGLATRKQVRLRFFEDPAAPWIDLLLYVPNGSASPAPVFLGLNYGNQGVDPDPSIEPSRHTRSARGEQAARWPLDLILRRGYAVATFASADVEPDRHGSGSKMGPDGWKVGIRGYWLGKTGAVDLADDAWGSLGAWAWGLSRALDFLATEKAVDARRVVVIGHSRTGKAALWAGAQDDRFALIVSNNSGQGGASLGRRRFGETVAASYSISGIWYCRNYRRYGGDESALPVDQHLLIACLAPRPVYIASAELDGWSDPRGEFLAAVHAEPAYRLFGRIGLGTASMPPLNTPIGDSIGYHLRTGDHEITRYDWERYLDFADRHLRKPEPKP